MSHFGSFRGPLASNYWDAGRHKWDEGALRR